MSELITVGRDLAKHVFRVHGAGGVCRAVLRKKLRRAQVLEFSGQLPSCLVAMETCGGAHSWGREIGKLGHEVRLIPPAHVKPFVTRQKKDAADSEAICEGTGLRRLARAHTPPACGGEKAARSSRGGDRRLRVSDLLCMTDPVHASPKGSMNDHLERNPG